MSLLRQCDWCGAVFTDSHQVALVDVEYDGEQERKLHACPDHVPDHLFPAADTSPLPDEEALIPAEAAQELGIAPVFEDASD